ncbi:MAG: LamG domain-containing protein [Nanoarchaeota archaeon]
MKNKRGLSGVITTLILVVVLLVASVIIWIAIKSNITKQTEDWASTDARLNLKITSVVDNGENISVMVKRNVGGGEISGLMFVVSDGRNTETIKKEKINLDKFEEKIFVLDYAGLVKEVSVAPIFTTESGKEKIGKEFEKSQASFVGFDVLEDWGLVSWWRMEGNADDEVGENDGTLIGGVQFIEDGERGKVASFDGDGDYIFVPDSDSFDMNNEFSIVVWFYPRYAGGGMDYRVLVSKNLYEYDLTVSRWCFWFASNGLGGYEGSPWISLDGQLNPNVGWYYIVWTVDGSDSKIYFYNSTGSLQVKNQAKIFPGTLSGSNPLAIGARSEGGSNFNGSIDEVMIFNKALSEDEVKAIYEMDLS